MESSEENSSSLSQPRKRRKIVQNPYSRIDSSQNALLEQDGTLIRISSSEYRNSQQNVSEQQFHVSGNNNERTTSEEPIHHQILQQRQESFESSRLKNEKDQSRKFDVKKQIPYSQNSLDFYQCHHPIIKVQASPMNNQQQTYLKREKKVQIAQIPKKKLLRQLQINYRIYDGERQQDEIDNQQLLQNIPEYLQSERISISNQIKKLSRCLKRLENLFIIKSYDQQN